MKAALVRIAGTLTVALAAIATLTVGIAVRASSPGLDQMIGQMLLIGFNGTSADAPQARQVAAHIAKGEIGGVILMDRNIRSPKQVRDLTRAFLETGQPLTPFVSVDQEGGLVQRLSASKGFKAYPAAGSIARLYTPDKAREIYKAMAEELADAGFNLNFGPVLDLNINRSNPIIGRRGRSFGDDPELVLSYARAFITAHRDANIITSVKHFPGHGSSWTDSHKRFVDLTKTWKNVEIEPYRVLAGEDAIDTLMVGHLYHPTFSGDERIPATLASTAIEGWVRGEIGFKGVVITDDLGMGAIKRHHKLSDTLIKAVLSGNDILLYTRAGDEPDFVSRATGILREAVEHGTIPRERIAEAYERILALKKRLDPNPWWLPSVLSAYFR